MVVETIVITQIVITLKGVAVVAAHNGLTTHQLYNFASTAHSMGIVPALEALVHTLAPYAVMGELVAALGKLIIALKEGNDLPEILSAVGRVTRAAFRLQTATAAVN